MSSTPVRIDGELFEAARASGAAFSRSAAQQLTHWARLGRELEASPEVSSRDVARVLARKQPYDSLTDPEQAIVRAAWDERIDQAHADLDLASEFRAAADTWSEADPDGTVAVQE